MALVAGLTGCAFHTDVPSGETITCTASETCPSGYTCEATLGRCIAISALTQPAPALSNVALTPTIGNLQTTFALTFDVSTNLLQPPTAYATSFGSSVQTFPFSCGACGPTAACACSFTPGSANPSPSEGPLHVWVELVGASGNAPPAFEAGAISIDLTPPALTNPAQLTLTPPPGVTTPVTELGVGGLAQVCFEVDEQLSGAPLVWAAGPGDAGVLGFAPQSDYPRGFFYCYVASLDGGTTDGDKAVWAALQDVAGNDATVLLVDLDGGLVVDTTLPAPPDTSADGGLVFHRAPWGELPELGVPVFTLDSAGPAIAKAGTLVVFADAARQELVGEGPVTIGPLAPLSLPGPDREAVYVDLVDQAGNSAPGGPFLVQNETWVATLGNKVAGDTLANPNDCYARPVLEPTLEQADDPATALSAPQPDAGSSSSIIGSGTWRMRLPGGPDLPDLFPPGNRTPSLSTYDSARGRVVLVLSSSDPNSPLDTWEYDGDWQQRFSVGVVPAYREGASLSYDALRGRTVLFGGNAVYSGFDLCDTWEWDGTLWREVKICTGYADGGTSDPSQPSPRSQSAQAYDRLRQYTVIFGGETQAGELYGDLWEYDGQRWSHLPAAASSPSPREGATMAFSAFADGGSGLVLVGGTPVGDGGGTNETWFGVWDGETYSWSKASGGGACLASEPDCYQTQLVDQPSPSDDLFLASFNDDATVRLWQWNGSDAWAVAGSFTSSSLFAFQATPGSLGGGAFVLAGLNSFDGNYQDWSCDSKLQCTTGHAGVSNPVPALQVAELAFDQSGNGVLFGGSDSSGNVDNGAYLWNGDEWSVIAFDGGAAPGARLGPALTFNPADGRFWLASGIGPLPGPAYFGTLDDAWALDLGSGWTYLGDTVNNTNSGFASLAFVPDAGHGPGMVLGNMALDTGEDTVFLAVLADGGLDPEELAPQPTIGPLVYDSQLGELLLISQNDNGAVLAFNPGLDGGWAQVATSPPVILPYAAYDSIAERALIIGEVRADPAPGDLYAFSGGPVTQVPIADPEGDGAPSNINSDEAVAFDPSRGVLLAYGGEDDVGLPNGDTWQFEQANHRPALVCAFRFATADAPAGSMLQSIQLHASGGADPTGAQLQVWEAGRWTTVGTCPGSCPSAQPAPLSFSTSDPVEMSLILSDLDTVGVGVTSGTLNAGGTTRVSAGPMQVTVSFRLP